MYTGIWHFYKINIYKRGKKKFVHSQTNFLLNFPTWMFHSLKSVSRFRYCEASNILSMLFSRASWLKCWECLNAEYNENKTCKDWILDLCTGMSRSVQIMSAYVVTSHWNSAVGIPVSFRISSTCWEHSRQNISRQNISRQNIFFFLK